MELIRDNFPVSTKNASSVSFLSVPDLEVSSVCDFFIIIIFFKLQFTLMMRKALTAHCKKIINIQRPDKDKSFLLVHNIKSSQHQIKPVGEKFVYSPKEAKLNSYCWMWKHIYSVLGEWSLDLLLVNALSGSICSS